MFVKNIENNLPFIQEVIDDFNSYNYNASERALRRSEIRFLMGTQHFFLCPTLVTRRKKNIFLWLQFSLTMSPHCGSLLSMVTGHFIGLLQLIIAIDYIISLTNPVYKNCHEAANWKQPWVCLLAISRKNPPIWRRNDNKWSSDAYNMRQMKELSIFARLAANFMFVWFIITSKGKLNITLYWWR